MSNKHLVIFNTDQTYYCVYDNLEIALKNIQESKIGDLAVYEVLKKVELATQPKIILAKEKTS